MPSSRTSRRAPALVAFGALFASSSLHAAPAPRVASPAVPPPTFTSMWTASTGGPWHLPASGEQVAFLDARHAVVLPTNPSPTNQLMLVDLVSGDVTSVAQAVSDTAAMLHLTRVGNRVLGFGTENATPAAWQLSLQRSTTKGEVTLTATSLEAPAGAAGAPADYPAVIVSPDERWILWCHTDAPPTLRDASTLRVVRSITVASCRRPSFPALDRVILGDEEVELPSGKVGVARGELREIVGPRHRLLEVLGDYQQLATVHESKSSKKITQRPFELSHDLRWTPDGIAISLTRDALNLRPAADGSPRTMRPRLPYSFQRAFAVSTTHALIVDGPSVELVDLNSGESKTYDGNLAAVTAIVPLAGPLSGTLATAADRLRLWRAGQLVSEETTDLSALRATASRLVAIDGSQQVWLWDPATSMRRLLGQVDAIVDAFLTTAGEDVWFSTLYTLEHSRAGQAARTQARFRINLTPLAYHPRGLFALGESPSTLYLADLANGSARRWQLAQHCELLPDGLFANRMLIRGLGELYVVDLDSGEIDAYETPGSGYPYLATSTAGDLAIADDDNVLALWHLGDDRARQLQLPLPEGDTVRVLRFSLDGASLAIGSTNGTVLHVAVADLKKSGQPLVIKKSQSSCFHGVAQPVSFVELGLTVSEKPSP